ncbi:UDP-N-acetyl-D-galactosamine dehydrogenase [Litorimonas taeanensis]|uniref:UDP-N-acetyl-D-galactosamine dehydrogenase n=1 Tax=Litorimonas taeanensis TaxID=568099 RepID=A0A420WDI8_9PROT|nr:Vi polysaccharide biosynthesis UDP-N-acetylglucosamine C-6 dehydrogenase TviB [Litorimonas taeanensis]RKQ69089.1 UDP-N-acetyl-D-galactosamine dehydrogenase [Litorimonas taeanensis]
MAESRIAIIGLGYVGLPLAVEFGKTIPTIGFDINAERVAELRTGVDHTLEVEPEYLSKAVKLSYSTDTSDIADCNIYIVTVPTPIDQSKQPDLTPVRRATEMLGKLISKDDIVIYESTVFPGCTANICVPILERLSGMKHNVDFFTGYSPERINPGDKEHRVTDIVKVTSGSTPEIAEKVDALYSSIITAGTYKAQSIEVAEAAKVIENTQRDLNIALMNELAIIFNKLDIDTQDVLDAAATKWNFLRFTPGLVGGHCIGVDPYYLTYRAQEVGYHPDVVLAGRRINDNMPEYIATRLSNMMMQKSIPVVGSNILVMGLTFKENCPDLRNSKVYEVIKKLQSFNANVDIYDPWVEAEAAKTVYNVDLLESLPQKPHYDAILLAVGHKEFKALGADAIRALGKDPHIFFDLKAIFDRQSSDARL